MLRDITVVPDSTFDRRGYFRTGMYFDFLGANDTPAAFRLDPAIGGLGAGTRMAQRIAMRHLEKPVWRGYRPDFHGLK